MNYIIIEEFNGNKNYYLDCHVDSYLVDIWEVFFTYYVKRYSCPTDVLTPENMASNGEIDQNWFPILRQETRENMKTMFPYYDSADR
jgi:hypothetical protein